MAACPQLSKDASKPLDPKKHKVDIMRLTIINGQPTAQRACTCKEDERRKREKALGDDVKALDFTADNIQVLTDVEGCLSSFLHMSDTCLGLNVVFPYLDVLDAKLPKKPEKGQTNLQSCCSDDKGPPTKTAPQSTLEDWSSVVGSTEEFIFQRLHDVTDSGDFDSFGMRISRWSIDAGKSKIEISISASQKESGPKQNGDVRNGGTAESKSKQTCKLTLKTWSKKNVDKEPSAKTKFTVNESKASKETGVEKELKPVVESESTKKVEATEKSNAEKKAKAIVNSDAQLNLKTTEESDAQKTSKTTKKSDDILESKATKKSDSGQKLKASEESESRNRVTTTEKSDAKQESRAAEELQSKTKTKTNEISVSVKPVPKKKVEATEDSDSRKKAEAAGGFDFYKNGEATQPSSIKQALKANKGNSTPGKEAEVSVDKSEVRMGTDNQEEKASRRQGSKNDRTCMTCGLQEPAPKLFKKCKRCKDEGCLDPPHYCGRDCQVSDWTTRHRQQHEKICAGDPVAS